MNGNSACSWEGVSDRPAEKSLRPDLQDLPLAFFEKVCK